MSRYPYGGRGYAGYPDPAFHANAWFSMNPAEVDRLTGGRHWFDGSQICRGYGYLTAKHDEVLGRETVDTPHGPANITYRVKAERPYTPPPPPPVVVPPPPPIEVYDYERYEPPPPPPRPPPPPPPAPPIVVDDCDDYDYYDDYEPPEPRPPPRPRLPPPPTPRREPPKPPPRRYRLVAKSRDPALAHQVQGMLDHSGLQGGLNPKELLSAGYNYVGTTGHMQVTR